MKREPPGGVPPACDPMALANHASAPAAPAAAVAAAEVYSVSRARAEPLASPGSRPPPRRS